MILIDDIDAFGTIIGGKNGDAFFIQQTYVSGTHPMTINGFGGNDTYDFINFGSGALKFNAIVNDGGNPWDNGDQIVVDGGSGSDSITLTGNGSGGDITGASNQLIHLRRTGRGRERALARPQRQRRHRRRSMSSPRARPSRSRSTAASATTSSPSAIPRPASSGSRASPGRVSRPRTASARSSSSAAAGSTRWSSTTTRTRQDRLGTLESWVEARQTAPDGTEVGAVGGLGMTLYAGFDARHVRAEPAGDGRIEFEDVEALTVDLGSGIDQFTIGGDTLRLELPQARQQKVFFFDQSPAVLTTILGNDGADVFPIISTTGLDRGAFDASDGLISVSTVHDGVPGSIAEQQHIDLRDGKTDSGDQFRLSLNGGAQTLAMPFTVDAATLQTNLRNATGIGTLTVTGGSGVFLVNFPLALGNVALLTATHVGKLVSGSTTQNGCDGLTGCGVAKDEIQHLHIDSTTTGGNGYFTVQLAFQETKALPLNVCASGPAASTRRSRTRSPTSTRCTTC